MLPITWQQPATKILCSVTVGPALAITRLSRTSVDFPPWPSRAIPVVFDATHSVQQPGGQGTSSGGQREFAPVLARAAVSVGIAALFIETHDNPATAISDGPNQIPLNKLPEVLSVLMELDKVAKANPVRLDMFDA